MKKRFGFVSNSSSSSFIVAFPFRPENYNEFDKKILKHWSEQVTKQVWRDIINQKFNDKNFIDELTSYFYYSVYEKVKKELSKTETTNNLYDKVEKRVRREARRKWNHFKAENLDAVFFMFSYADEDGEFFSYMEHGGIFDHLPNIRINHH